MMTAVTMVKMLLVSPTHVTCELTPALGVCGACVLLLIGAQAASPEASTSVYTRLMPCGLNRAVLCAHCAVGAVRGGLGSSPREVSVRMRNLLCGHREV